MNNFSNSHQMLAYPMDVIEHMFSFERLFLGDDEIGLMLDLGPQ